ncbi:Phospholipase D [Psidium guajava]|nr:Phospholipase D [Psidium guajava]
MVLLRLHQAFPLPSRDGGDSSDRGGKIIGPDHYVTVHVPHATIARTRVVHNAQNPRWNQRFFIALAHPVVDLEFRVEDDDIFGGQLIGTCKIPARKIADREVISGPFTLVGASANATLLLELKFTPMEMNPGYKCGIAGDLTHQGVRHTYFP